MRAMMQWANDGRTGDSGKRFFPSLHKSSLFARGYIAEISAHSTGTAIDVTLVAIPTAPVAKFDVAAAYAPCTGPAEKRSPDNSFDMGTGFDCFDGNSHTASAAISAEQMRWRALLVAVMASVLHKLPPRNGGTLCSPQGRSPHDDFLHPRPRVSVKIAAFRHRGLGR